jgi:predicted metal-dependent hydrolase
VAASTIRDDRRLADAIAAFNRGAWYEAHDGFEELWHETHGPLRPQLQAILQIAVAQLHLERHNLHGAMVLMGEGLGRLVAADPEDLGLDLEALTARVKERLSALQHGQDISRIPDPVLDPLARAL